MKNMNTAHNSVTGVEVVNAYMRGVFRWMMFGLLVTAILSYTIIQSPSIMNTLITQPILFIGLIIAEFALVFYISARVATLSASSASGLFLLYSALNGITIAPMLSLYTGASIAGTFVITAGMFGAMSVYGLFTKKDLTSWGSFLIMGLIGVIIASVVNIFLKSTGLEMLISYLGVFIFLGLTAFDVQKLKEMGQSMPAGDATVAQRGIILGALTLYLDFINLFLFLLRIFGRRE